jgi:hypothetical protein
MKYHTKKKAWQATNIIMEFSWVLVYLLVCKTEKFVVCRYSAAHRQDAYSLWLAEFACARF